MSFRTKLMKVPQKNTFDFEHEGRLIRFDSNFDSGNLGRVEKHPTESHYSVWTASDCEGTDK